MAWYEKQPRHAGVRDWLMMGWAWASVVPAVWATGQAVDYFATYSDRALTVYSLGVGALAYAVVYCVGLGIIRPR